MNIQNQINRYISAQSDQKRKDMEELHRIILKINPDAQLWFLDGKDSNNKVVSNPNIGYGSLTIKYTDGKTKQFYTIGLSANTTGISVYIMGIEDKKYLAETFGKELGKASVTGYCIKFKKLEDINLNILKEAIKFGFENSNG